MSNDTVLQQVQMVYDSDSNVIETIDRESAAPRARGRSEVPRAASGARLLRIDGQSNQQWACFVLWTQEATCELDTSWQSALSFLALEAEVSGGC
jgi:hypothetical protein